MHETGVRWFIGVTAAAVAPKAQTSGIRRRTARAIAPPRRDFGSRATCPLRCLAWGLLLFCSGYAGHVSAAKLTDKQRTHIEEPRPAGLPSDKELEAARAVIGRIEIDIRNIFDENDPRENRGLYRLADRLHIRTKPATIRAQLLFKSGDRYSAQKLAETERNLRLLPYIYDARVVPVRFADGKVDVKVITRDVWTLDPNVSFGRSGGTNSTSASLQEQNLFGWGKSLEVGHTSNIDRTSTVAQYSDPNVLGSRWTTALTYADSSDGHQRSALISQPFYSLDTRWSATIVAQSYDRTISRYFLGDIVDQFNNNENTYQISGGVSTGLVDGWSKRVLFGMYYDRNDFLPTPATTLPANPLPPQRTLSYPFVGFDILEDKYGKVGDENQIGKTEDLYFGTAITGELGFSDAIFGANHDALMVKSAVIHGFELPYEPATLSERKLLFANRERPRAQSDRQCSREVLLALAPGLAPVRIALGDGNTFARPGRSTSAGRRQWAAWLPPALRGGYFAGPTHDRATRVHRLVSVQARAGGWRHFYGCRQNVGERRGGQQRSWHAERRRIRLAAG